MIIYYIFLVSSSTTLNFFVGSRGTPGAGDTLIASVMALKSAELFGRHGKKRRPGLANTRLVFLSFDAEEAGLRGARAYVKRHREEISFHVNAAWVYGQCVTTPAAEKNHPIPR